jgi:RepB DNA-primase from phage plasmid
MRSHGHQPCLVLQSSPGNLQAWLHVSHSPLPPVLATAAAKQLARAYGADLASADWRHLGRLAGFTNQKPQRRLPTGQAPWVKIVHAHPGVASHADRLLLSATASVAAAPPPTLHGDGLSTEQDSPSPIDPAEAIRIYRYWVCRWRIAERYPHTDWSIVDLWIARQLLSQGTPAAVVRAVVQLASPQFPRRHGNAEDYLRRTLRRAAFPPPARPVCATDPAPFPAAAIRIHR